MLLTQSHASILLSTAIVLFFTTALFLSGFAIQRRTLRDLRAAIKPQPHPSPKIVLPDRFRAHTTELDDGTVVVVESEAEREAREIEAVLRGVVAVDIDESIGEKKKIEEKGRKSAAGEHGVVVVETTSQDQTLTTLATGPGDQEDAGASEQKQISRAERRRLIKEELHKLAQGDKKVAYQRRVW